MRRRSAGFVADIMMSLGAVIGAYILTISHAARQPTPSLPNIAADQLVVGGDTGVIVRASDQGRLLTPSVNTALSRTHAISNTLALLPPGVVPEAIIVRHTTNDAFSIWLGMSPVGGGDYPVWVVAIETTGLSSGDIAKIIGIDSAQDFPLQGIFTQWRESSGDRMSVGGLFGDEVPERTFARLAAIQDDLGEAGQ